MRFEEKSILATTLVGGTLSAAYCTVVLRSVVGSANRQAAFTGLAIGAATLQAVLVVGRVGPGTGGPPPTRGP
jgi:hypothetical protein